MIENFGKRNSKCSWKANRKITRIVLKYHYLFSILFSMVNEVTAFRIWVWWICSRTTQMHPFQPSIRLICFVASNGNNWFDTVFQRWTYLLGTYLHSRWAQKYFVLVGLFPPLCFKCWQSTFRKHLLAALPTSRRWSVSSLLGFSRIFFPWTAS